MLGYHHGIKFEEHKPSKRENYKHFINMFN